MTRMRTVDAAVRILEIEGATQAFGLPGAAINPFYSAMRAHGGIKHILARHVEGAWPRGTPGPRPATSASASGPPARPGPT